MFKEIPKRVFYIRLGCGIAGILGIISCVIHAFLTGFEISTWFNWWEEIVIIIMFLIMNGFLYAGFYRGDHYLDPWKY